MGQIMFFSIKICFIIYLISICYGQETARGPKRTKVSPYAGIVPFIRTGRSRLPFSFPDLEVSEENSKRSKPSTSLIAFPRVGRDGAMEWARETEWNAMQKRTGPNNMNNGLWFGPRLGRIHKRQEYNKQDKPPLAFLYFGSSDYTPRLGRESEEFLDDVDTATGNDEQENDKSAVENV